MPSWLSIHAPKRFDQLAMPQKIRDQFIRASLSGDPPHLLITGPAGVGKTAAWRLVARQVLGPGWKSTCHVLQARDLSRQAGAMKKFEEFLRPSGQKSADTLAGRTSLDAFDRNMWEGDVGEAPCGEETKVEFGRAPVSRLIVIEDADHLGSRRQPYLRRMMESESHTTRFIFTARAPSRIIDALRSRMQHIRIPSIEIDKIESTVEKVASLERVDLAEGMSGDIAHVANGNLRKALFTTELLARRGMTGTRNRLYDVVSASTLQHARRMVELALRGRVIEWRWEKKGGRNVKTLEGAMGQLDEMMGVHALDAEDVVHQIHMELTGNRLMLAPELRNEMLDALSICDVALRGTIHPRIQIEHFLHEISQSGRRHGLAM
ncbi:MAG TPA: AAA family ATPase [Candidatus Poseidoniales archaeon]|nr:MAG TPA: AAA family ATPase [Candidatus Poseidoniales archaeon]HIH81518.1 AAA family ATPase [Candidatus Thalassarchaeaceae archaeon]